MKHTLKNMRTLATGMYVLSLLIFGTNGLFVSNLSLGSSQIVFMRTLIGGIFLTGLVLCRGGFDKEALRAEGWTLLLGGAALGFNWIALFEAYRQLNVSLATLIYYMGPMLVLLLSPVLLGEKLTGRKIFAILIAAIGLLCISGSIAAEGTKPLGLVIAILSAAFYAALILVNKKIVRTGGMQTAAIELDVAFVFVAIYTLCTAGMPRITAQDWPFVAGIGLVNTALAYFLYFSGMQKLPGQSVALISYLDPVSALIFSAFLLREAMTPVEMIGAVLILAGALLGELPKKKTADDRPL